jgi:hypothetical protein
MADLENVEAVRDALDKRFAHDRRVNGVSLGRGNDGLVVRVHVVSEEDLPDLDPEIDGVPVEREVIGDVMV